MRRGHNSCQYVRATIASPVGFLGAGSFGRLFPTALEIAAVVCRASLQACTGSSYSSAQNRVVKLDLASSDNPPQVGTVSIAIESAERRPAKIMHSQSLIAHCPCHIPFPSLVLSRHDHSRRFMTDSHRDLLHSRTVHSRTMKFLLSLCVLALVSLVQASR